MSRQIGLENLTVAIIEEDKTTGIRYATPIKLERSIKAKISPKTSSEKLYSDDSVEEILNNFDSCDVEIEINQLQIATRALIQGAKIVNGLLVENKDDIAPELALGFRSKKSNGKYRYVWLLKGKFEITEDEYETIGEKPTAQSNSINGSFYGRNYDGNWRIMEDEDVEGANEERISHWFTEIPTLIAEETPTEENQDESNTENQNNENESENNTQNQTNESENNTQNENTENENNTQNENSENQSENNTENETNENESNNQNNSPTETGENENDEGNENDTNTDNENDPENPSNPEDQSTNEENGGE